MRIAEMFSKPIERDIQGVIKTGQTNDNDICQELEEYVVTNELLQHFHDFFEAYKKSITGNTDKMGVWISGFFGSGKSHFLKILSYLLNNKEVKGKQAYQYLEGKIPNSNVMANIKSAADISTDVILFNIDSKSDAHSPMNKEPLVKVFVKVFNEMQGFCGSLPWVAELEQQMVLEGTYQEFKKVFYELSEREWDKVRDDLYYYEDIVVESLARTTKMSLTAARNWFSKAGENYVLNVEKFARNVKDYINRKGENHHVVFLVDEIGQYIGNETQLMLNLQTIVEDLGIQCGGNAWIIVTSQQGLDTVTKTHLNDFSKILGRFNTRLNFSSSNVEEVIRKRILLKNNPARDQLKDFYETKSAVLKNLIAFSSDTTGIRSQIMIEDFIDCYPFIPYQFKLLQQVLNSVRIYGATGKHLAEGERSMLLSFQKAAVKHMNSTEESLIPFTAFYDTLEALLDSNIRGVVIQAQEHDQLRAFDVDVLKTLFLIKYVKGISGTIENLAALMVRSIEDDKINLKKMIDEALKRLSKEGLIQKNGDQYTFLTEDEQDINREIKAIPVDLEEVIQKISEIIFEEIYPFKKYKYSDHYTFAFNQIVDNRYFRGDRRCDIGLEILTPFFEGTEGTDSLNSQNELGTREEITQSQLKLRSASKKNLIVKLLNQAAFLEETAEVLKIDTYLRRMGGGSLSEKLEELRLIKNKELIDRKNRVRLLLAESIRHADFYVNSQKLEIKPKDPAARLNDGLKFLIESIYSKLHYMEHFTDSIELQHSFTRQELTAQNRRDGVESHNDQLKERNKLALNEVAEYIERNTIRNIPISMKSVLSLYRKAPYGWLKEDIQWIIGKLFLSKDIKLRLEGRYLDTNNKDIVEYLTKHDYADKLMLEKRIMIPNHHINSAKNLCKELFNVIASFSDEDQLMSQFKALVREELAKVDELFVFYRQTSYPGYRILQEGKTLLNALSEISEAREFYAAMHKQKEKLLDYAEYSLDIKKFFESSQKDYFDRTLVKIKQFQKNQNFIEERKVIELVQQLQTIVNMEEPYSQIHKLSDLTEQFELVYRELIRKECEPVRQVIQRNYQKVQEVLAKYELEDSAESEAIEKDTGKSKCKCIPVDRFKAKFDELFDRIETAENFYEVIALKEESHRLKLRYLCEIEQGTKSVENAQPGNKKTIRLSFKDVLNDSKILESESDIEDVIREVKTSLDLMLQQDVGIELE